ncbi:MAG: hypothetical protein P4L73_13510 [Caulobacteraceae bacterium]|nr:hypothetical protein [Caulobacteraceae bacterium]
MQKIISPPDLSVRAFFYEGQLFGVVTFKDVDRWLLMKLDVKASKART